MALVESQDLLDMAHLGHASTPLDLMTYEAADLQPSIFFLKETSRQSIVTVFNWSETSRQHTLTRAALGLDPKANYTVSEILAKTGSSAPLGAAVDIQQPSHSVRIFKIVNTDIAAKPPVVTATVESTGKAGEPIVFQAVSSDENNPAFAYSWDFGDGVILDGAKATHAYTHSGVYTAHLKAAGFGSEPNVQTFPIKITGAITTKFIPENKRRFVEGQP
jgi:PKD repeat protein